MCPGSRLHGFLPFLPSPDPATQIPANYCPCSPRPLLVVARCICPTLGHSLTTLLDGTSSVKAPPAPPVVFGSSEPTSSVTGYQSGTCVAPPTGRFHLCAPLTWREPRPVPVCEGAGRSGQSWAFLGSLLPWVHPAAQTRTGAREPGRGLGAVVPPAPYCPGIPPSFAHKLELNWLHFLTWV